MRYCLAPPQSPLQISPNIARSLTTVELGANVGTLATTVAATAAVVSAYYARQARGRLYGPVLKKNLKNKILKSTYPPEYKDVSPYIPRRGLPDFTKIFAAMEKQKTVIVCGPRGSGKSAAVRDSLAGEKKVIVATVDGEDDFDEKIARAITKSLGQHTTADENHTELVMNTLKTMQAKKWSPPVLVVEVNERFTSPDALQNLILTLKKWGHDKGFVYPVVVLSTSRAALGLKLSMDALRAQYVSVGDLHKDEAECYIKELCNKLKLVGADDEKAVSECAQNIVEIIGCRLLHLDGVADNVRFLKSTNEKVALEDLKVVAAKYEQIQMEESREALQELYETFPTEEIHRQFFEKPGAAVNMDDFCKSVGKERKIVLETLSKIQPHPFYMDPDTRTVIVGSIFFQKVIDESNTNFCNNND